MDRDNKKANENLDSQVAGGLAWSAGAKWLTQLITWGSVFVAARLLSPSDFGFAEMGGFIIIFTNLVAEFGIGTAVLQMPEMDERIVKQLHTVSVALCAAVFAFVIAVAPLVATFFSSFRLKYLIYLGSLSLFITGFQCIPQGLLQKDLDYRRLSMAEAAQALSQALVTIVCAVMGFGYWSLVTGSLTGKASSAFLTAYWKPISFATPNWSEIKAPLSLASHVMISRLAFAAYSLSDGIIVGRVFGQEILGFYRMAINLATVPVEKIGMLIMRVTGPLFARVQFDPALVRRYLLVISEAISLSTLPLTVGLAIVAPEVIAVFLGPKWLGATSALRWLAIFDILRLINTLTGQVLTSLRFTAFNMWMALLTSVVMPISFIVASHWGVGAVAASWTFLAPLTVGPSIVKLLRVSQLRYREYFGSYAHALLATVAMAVAVVTIRSWVLPEASKTVFKLTFEVLTGATVYCGTLLLTSRDRLLRYYRFIRDSRRNGPDLLVSDGIV